MSVVCLQVSVVVACSFQVHRKTRDESTCNTLFIFLPLKKKTKKLQPTIVFVRLTFTRPPIQRKIKPNCADVSLIPFDCRCVCATNHAPGPSLDAFKALICSFVPAWGPINFVLCQKRLYGNDKGDRIRACANISRCSGFLINARDCGASSSLAVETIKKKHTRTLPFKDVSQL